MTYAHSRMQVQASGLPSPSVIVGEPGTLSQVGKPWMERKTSVGPKPLASSYLSSPSLSLDVLADTLKYTAITKESSKPGGTSGAETGLLTESFVVSTRSSNLSTTPYPFTQPVLYTPPPSPSGLRGQSEQSEDSPSSPKTVRKQSEESEDSPRTVQAESEHYYSNSIFYSARTLFGLC